MVKRIERATLRRRILLFGLVIACLWAVVVLQRRPAQPRAVSPQPSNTVQEQQPADGPEVKAPDIAEAEFLARIDPVTASSKDSDYDWKALRERYDETAPLVQPYVERYRKYFEGIDSIFMETETGTFLKTDTGTQSRLDISYYHIDLRNSTVHEYTFRGDGEVMTSYERLRVTTPFSQTTTVRTEKETTSEEKTGLGPYYHGGIPGIEPLLSWAEYGYSAGFGPMTGPTMVGVDVRDYSTVGRPVGAANGVEIENIVGKTVLADTLSGDSPLSGQLLVKENVVFGRFDGNFYSEDVEGWWQLGQLKVPLPRSFHSLVLRPGSGKWEMLSITGVRRVEFGVPFDENLFKMPEKPRLIGVPK